MYTRLKSRERANTSIIRNPLIAYNTELLLPTEARIHRRCKNGVLASKSMNIAMKLHRYHTGIDGAQRTQHNCWLIFWQVTNQGLRTM